ncbi:MAG: LysM peptidoglycan-binding domain-containing protein [Planctomycetes bacterium]|nr:LysM peptidoglycan-binding domain-containing protein [Planctomycetota bacterium]
MGKIEKVVFLCVLFLMVVITVVSMTGTKDENQEQERSAVVDRSQNRLRSNDRGDLGTIESRGTTRWSNTSTSKSATTRKPASTAPQANQPANTEGLLSAPVTSRNAAAKRAEVQPVAANAGASRNNAGLVKPKLQVTQQPALDPSWTLTRVDGLQDTINPAYKTYTCKAGDTFDSLAQHYYGDKRHAHFLRRNNEGVRKLTQGMVLQMPCVNDSPLGETHTVVEGDSLWSIAKDHYKAGHRWQEIFNANRHVLRSPDDLRTGLVLTIP